MATVPSDAVEPDATAGTSRTGRRNTLRAMGGDMRTPTIRAERDADGPVRTVLAAGSAAARDPRLLVPHAVLSRPGRVQSRAALARTADTRRYGRARTVTIDAPPGAPSELDLAAGTYELARPFVITVTDALLVDVRGVVLNGPAGFLLESTLGRRDLLDRAALATPRLLAAAAVGPQRLSAPAGRSIAEPVCSLVDAAMGGYSHWLLTAVPRLAGLAAWEHETGAEPDLLVPADPPSWIPETLAVLGYGDRLREVRDVPTRLRRLVVPSVRSPEQRRSAFVKSFTTDPSYKLVAPGACRWLRERALDSVAVPDSLPSRLYVSRADAGRREVRNREALLERLAPRGFAPFVPSEHPVAEQVARFAAADVVVAPHGAALSNLVWATDVDVVELFGAKVKPTYCMLAGTVGHGYAAVVGDGDRLEGDFAVDPTDVTNALDRLDDA